MNRFTTSENLLSNLSSGRLLAFTAPFVMDQDVPIGYAVAPEEGYCVNLRFDEFISLSLSIYEQVNTLRIFHGLKRIWEFLDERGLRTEMDRHKDININEIEDIRLMTYLLDPDSSEEVDFGEYRVQ